MITVAEAARRARRNPETVRRWIREGKLTAVKVGTQHVIDEVDLAEVLGGTDLAERPRRTGEAATPSWVARSDGEAAVTLDVWLPRIVGRLVRALDPVRIVLFGARARGENRPDDDYELLVILDHADDRRAARLDVRRLLDDLPISKDVIVATTSDVARPTDEPSGALSWALAEGKAIYERP